MRIIDYTDGCLEVRFMWLPMFISQNMAVMKELEIAGKAKFQGIEMSCVDDALDKINEWVIDWLCKRFVIRGLGDYLRAIKHVGMEERHVPV